VGHQIGYRPNTSHLVVSLPYIYIYIYIYVRRTVNAGHLIDVYRPIRHAYTVLISFLKHYTDERSGSLSRFVNSSLAKPTGLDLYLLKYFRRLFQFLVEETGETITITITISSPNEMRVTKNIYKRGDEMKK